MKKLIAALLCLVTLLSLLAACGNKDNVPSDDSNASDSVTVGETTPETDEEGFLLDGLPSVKYGGKDISILTWDSHNDYRFPKELTTDTVSYAAYVRNEEIQDRFEVNFKVTSIPGHWDVINDFIAQAEKANDAGYDLICSYSLAQSPLALSGINVNLLSLDYPQTEQIWWSESVEAWTQFDALFFACGTSSVTNFTSMMVVYYLREAVEAMELKDPAQLVVDGEWTLEKLIEYSSNWDGPNADDPNGLYGFAVSHYSAMDDFYYSAGFKAVEEDAEKGLVLSASATHINLVTQYIDDLFRLLDRDGAVIAPAYGTTEHALLHNQQAAFMLQSMGQLMYMEKAEHGVLPTPAWTTEQAATGNYHVLNNNGYDVWSVPKSAQDTAMSGVILDAIVYSDYHDMAPVFFEKRLKYRYSDTELGFRVFDIIRNAQVYDFGRITQVTTGGIAETPFRGCFWESSTMFLNNNYSTTLTGNLQKYNNALDELLTLYKIASKK